MSDQVSDASEGHDLDQIKLKRSNGPKSCCLKIKDVLSLVPKHSTPPNWPILWLVFISLFSSSFTLTFVFPFLPEMILTLGYVEEDKGTYAGLIASSVFAGRAVGSFFWGWLADRKGRRLVLLLTIALNGIFSFLFGFADTFLYCMVLRFLAGLANGTVGVAKTVLYDVSDNTNQAFYMSVISIAWGSGLILGPTIGGYLALPARKYHVFSDSSFLTKYPFVLPSFCCLLVCLVCFVIVFVQFHDPEPVVNEVIISAAGKEEGAETKLITVNKDEDSFACKTGDATQAVLPSQQPPSPSMQPVTSFDPAASKERVTMSLETLHCEADLSYYYAQVESEKRSRILNQPRERRPKEGAGEGPWLSLCNLSHVGGTNMDSSTRPRCSSYSEQTLRDTALRHRADNFHPVTKHSVIKENTVEHSARNGSVAIDDDSGRLHVAGDHSNGGGRTSSIENRKETCVSVEQSVKLLAEDSSLVSVKDGERKSCPASCCSAIRNSALIKLLSISDVLHSICLYAVLSFAVIGYDDLFTVFASTSQDLDGLGFSTDEIGTALGVVYIPLMFIQIKLYPLIVAKFGIRKTYIINIFFVFVPVQLLPMLHLLINQKVWLWACLMLLCLPMKIATNSCFAGTSLLVNNSVTPDMAGKANGIGMTASAVARTLAPTLGGAFFSWSLKTGLDVNFTFFFFGFVLFLSAIHCLFMPDHLDHQKK